MKKQELVLLIQAGNVERIVLSRKVVNNAAVTNWALCAYGGEATSARGNVLKTARGERRYFRTLETAYEFARECGWVGEVSVSDD